MNTIIESFHSSAFYALGYTLLHSLWQAAAVLVLVTIILRLIPTRLSNVRYGIASISQLVILWLSIGTFLYLYSVPNVLPQALERSITDESQKITSIQPFALLEAYWNVTKSFIHTNLPFFLMLWISGTLIFLLRILGGLLYVAKLRENSISPDSEWNQKIQELAQHLKITRWVKLAESSYIKVPVVIGYLKPMVLVPIGMISTLSSEQLETIFLHELMHIRRNDYLINLLQSFLEALFFFNPFVWIITGIIKREREHCCDDAVVQLHGNAMVYAHALASLEEVRLSKEGLAISLAENKNQLLNRIKRLMEKSVKNYSSRERIIPAMLLIIGLICASWISNQTSEYERASNQTNKVTVLSDTTKKNKKIKKNKKATNAKEISATKDKGKSGPEIMEEFETDYALKLNQGPTPIPPVPDMATLAPLFPNLNLPPVIHFDGPPFAWRNEQGWQEFSKEFEEEFKTKFGDFYAKHQEDIQKMVQEVQEKVNSRFGEDWQVQKMQELATKQEELAKIHAEKAVQKMEELAARDEELAHNQAEKWEREAEQLSRQAERMANVEENKKHLEKLQADRRREFEKRQETLEKKMRAFEERTKLFEAELKKELIKDGYLSQDEKLTNMHWHNGSIEINGKKIKATDEKKYNELHEKFFQHPKEPEAVD